MSSTNIDATNSSTNNEVDALSSARQALHPEAAPVDPNTAAIMDKLRRRLQLFEDHYNTELKHQRDARAQLLTQGFIEESMISTFTSTYLVNQMNLERARGVFSKLIALFELDLLTQLALDRAIPHPNILRRNVLLIAKYK